MSTAPMSGGPRRGQVGDQQPTDEQPGYYDRPDQDPQGFDQRTYEHQGYYGRQGPGRRPSGRPSVDPGRLWSGGVATAVVAALIALVGVLVCRWLFNIPLLAPMRAGAYGDVHTTDLVLGAAGAALAATAVMHLLLLSTPRPVAFFGWIIGLATILAVLLPFSTTAPLTAKAATAVVDLILGVAIGSLLSGVAARSVRPSSGVR